MQFPDPRALVTKWRETKTFSQMGIGQLQNTIQQLEIEIAALQAISRHFESEEWTWLTETFLPSETRRIEHARSSIEPDNVTKQCIIQGQVNEILHLQEILIDAKSSLTMLENTLRSARESEVKLRQRSQKK